MFDIFNKDFKGGLLFDKLVSMNNPWLVYGIIHECRSSIDSYSKFVCEYGVSCFDKLIEYCNNELDINAGELSDKSLSMKIHDSIWDQTGNVCNLDIKMAKIYYNKIFSSQEGIYVTKLR